MTLPIGYPDFQRVVDWDGPVLWSKNTGSTNLPVQSGLLEVSKYAAIGGRLQCTVGPIAVQLQYKADKAGLIGAGNRNFQMSELMGDSAVPTMRNLGPYVNVVCSSPAGADYQLVADLFATNRLQPVEFTPAISPLISEQSVLVGAGGSLIAYPAGYYAGPVMTWFLTTGQPGLITLEFLTSAGIWEPFTQRSNAASTGVTSMDVVPAGAWRAHISNTGGAAASYYLVITPSSSGSS